MMSCGHIAEMNTSAIYIVGAQEPGIARGMGLKTRATFEEALEDAKRKFTGPAPRILALPQTYMNLSGEAVSRLVRWYRLPPENLMVVYDDVDLPQGAIRIRKNGSAGTHNGMRSIVELLGYENFPRLRVGVGQRRPGYELADWVLGHYLPGEEQQTADTAYALAADAIIEYITNGVESAMCKYNTKKTKKPPEPAEGADA